MLAGMNPVLPFSAANNTKTVFLSDWLLLGSSIDIDYY